MSMTIIEAIKKVLVEPTDGLSVDEIYKEICGRNLYSFGAKNPKGVVNGEIRRHCYGLDFPTASPIKHFYVVKMKDKKPVFNLLTDEILQRKVMKGEKGVAVSADVLPEEKVDSVVNSYNNQIKQRLMELIMTREASFFEQLVVELLLKMGYGYGEAAAGQVVGKSHDGGIDGIISEDKLGLGLIYIQAKRYDKGIKVGRKELQAFAGAMRTVNKGVFLTTSKFTKEAEEFAALSEKHISLVDGDRLCEFMLVYGVGVRLIKTYRLYKVDEEYFNQ